MTDNKKELERAELHRTIWNIANDLRGSVDGWYFRQYVLGLLFYRYISENLNDYINKIQKLSGVNNFNYKKLSNNEALKFKNAILKNKGLFILPDELFCNLHAGIYTDKNLSETLKKIFQNIENSAKGTESEKAVRGLFDDFEFKSSKLGATQSERNKKLAKLIDSIANMKLGLYKDSTIDAFGDAYEYLMTMYASNAGKSGGEYYTPPEVSELLAKITLTDKKEINKVYDPACGSGALLLQFAKILGKGKIHNGFFGQELNITTYNLCRINMFLHDIGYKNFHIEQGDTLKNPLLMQQKPFDAIVSNPPYSLKWEGDKNPNLVHDKRFSPAGVLAPSSKADMAFIMHSLYMLSQKGTAAIICFPGVLYRGGAEQKIRKYLIDNNFIDCIIQLPDNLFFGTSVATCIMVLKKSKKDNSVLFIDAQKECDKLLGCNKLSKDNISTIINTYKQRNNIEYLSKNVLTSQIKKQDYNLAVNTYIKSPNINRMVDVAKLNKELTRILKREKELRERISKNNLDELLMHSGEIQYKKIGEICTITRGRVISKDYIRNNTGDYPVYSSQTENNGELGKISTYDYDGEYITWTTDGVNAGSVFYRCGKFSITNVCGLLTIKVDNVLPKYLAYVLKINTGNYVNRGMGNPKLMSNVMAKISVPIPGLDIQKRIIHELDNFTGLIDEISSELALRKQLFEHYSEKLLSFKNE